MQKVKSLAPDPTCGGNIVEKNVSFQIESTQFNGKIIYSNADNCNIKCTLLKPDSSILQKLFENGSIFEFSGIVEKTEEFTALNCDVREGIRPVSYLFIENTIELNYKIDIGKLYLNASHVNDEMSVKKVDVRFSSVDEWIPNEVRKKIFINQNDCFITLSNSFITIEPSSPITLQQLDKMLFDLQVFFEVLILNNSVKTIEKYIYTIDDTKIEEVMRYKQEPKANEKFLFRYDTNNIESILNHWFEAKNVYGKIFSYLSGILNESSAEYLDLKFLMLAQWIEAYSREFLNNKVQTIINECVENSEANTYRKNLKQLFQTKNIDEIIFGNSSSQKRNKLIDQIICYRDHLVHLNVKDDLNRTQMINLYEILKDLIYIFLIKELDVAIDDRRINEVRRKYMRYETLSKSITPCRDKKSRARRKGSELNF